MTDAASDIPEAAEFCKNASKSLLFSAYRDIKVQRGIFICLILH